MSQHTTEQETNTLVHTAIAYYRGKPIKLGSGTLKRAGHGGVIPAYHCENCRCDRYTKCGCIKKSDK